MNGRFCLGRSQPGSRSGRGAADPHRKRSWLAPARCVPQGCASPPEPERARPATERRGFTFPPREARARIAALNAGHRPAVQITGLSGCRRTRSVADPWPRGIVRSGITTGGQVAPVTLGYLGSSHQDPEVGGTWVPRAGRSAQSWASASPTETPQLSDTAADPHRNPTDETAHSGTLVMPVKRTENSRSATSMRVNWAVGAFSR
jgi:hypothetical protein